jgi:hypothetical protein
VDLAHPAKFAQSVCASTSLAAQDGRNGHRSTKAFVQGARTALAERSPLEIQTNPEIQRGNKVEQHKKPPIDGGRPIGLPVTRFKDLVVAEGPTFCLHLAKSCLNKAAMEVRKLTAGGKDKRKTAGAKPRSHILGKWHFDE